MAHQTVGRRPSASGGQFQELRLNNHVYSYCHFNVIIQIAIKERGKRDDNKRKRELDLERLSSAIIGHGLFIFVSTFYTQLLTFTFNLI